MPFISAYVKDLLIENHLECLSSIKTETVYNTTLNGTVQLVDPQPSHIHILGTATGWSLILSDATKLQEGFEGFIFNLSSQAVLIKDGSGTTLLTLASQAMVFVWLHDNTTVAGIWTYIQFLINTSGGSSSYISFSRSGGVAAGAYLNSGQTLTSTSGFSTSGNGYITRLAVTNSSAMASGKSVTFRLQRRTGLSTFVDITGTDITITAGNYAATINNIQIPVGPDWELCAYRITSDGGGGSNNVNLNVFIVGV